MVNMFFVGHTVFFCFLIVRNLTFDPSCLSTTLVVVQHSTNFRLNRNKLILNLFNIHIANRNICSLVQYFVFGKSREKKSDFILQKYAVLCEHCTKLRHMLHFFILSLHNRRTTDTYNSLNVVCARVRSHTVHTYPNKSKCSPEILLLFTFVIFF